jgi:hypothetical protein
MEDCMDKHVNRPASFQSGDMGLPHTIQNQTVKGKVISVFFLSEHHAMEVYRESGGIAPRIL